jgi:hypothetical protein
MTDQEDVQTEEYQVAGEGLLAKIKELIRQGNIRRVIIRNDEGQTLIEIPLTWGLVGAAFAPIWAAVGAIAALAANFTIVVEKTTESKED